MRFQELNEADIANFADHAGDTLNRIGDVAAKAYGKFKAHGEKQIAKHQKRVDDDEDLKARIKHAHEDILDAGADVETDPSPTNQRTLDKAKTILKNLENELALPYEQRAAFAKLQKTELEHDTKVDKRLANKEKEQIKLVSKNLPPPQMVAAIVLGRTPDVNDLPELEGLGAEKFNSIQNTTDQMQSRFEKFGKRLAITLAKSDLVTAQERDQVADRLGDQKDNVVESAETMLMQNKNGEQEAWTIALTNDDGDVAAKSLIALVREISDINQKKNMASMTQSAGKKILPEGLNLLNMIGAQRQVIEMRLGLLKAALVQMEGSAVKPMTTEQLRRIRALAKRL